ncbi:MAG: type IA DNA topoisomerase, partial [Blautia sp.]|nr:type IA DNA topoisomerase [Blautia sp.]
EGAVPGMEDRENTVADAEQGKTEGAPQPGETVPASAAGNLQCRVEKIERKKENRNPPMLFNLAELQNVCSKLFKISPDQTLAIAQELYEKKLVTYPRTDAHVLSTAVAKEIHKNISGLIRYDKAGAAAQEAYDSGTWKNIARTRYVNDKQITDHYAIIPTGQGLSALGGLSLTAQRVYETIVRRFLCIFYPAAVYQKVNLVTKIGEESFFSGFKVLVEEGYLRIADNSFSRRNRQKQEGEGKEDSPKDSSSKKDPGKDSEREGEAGGEIACDAALLEALQKLRKNTMLPVEALTIKEGETSPPKRYNSGSMILAMENAGQLIEDEDLRAQIKGAGIGTSATRAEILKKLFHIEYLSLNRKTQVITPTLLGEMVHDVVNCSIRQLLNPDLTASWEKGLNYVAEGSITEKEYMDKLEHFVRVRTNQVQQAQNVGQMRKMYDSAAVFYKKEIQKK